MRRLFQLIKEYNYFVVFLLLTALSLTMIFSNNNYHQSKWFTWSNGLSGRLYMGINSIHQYFGLRSENDRLSRENAYLRDRLAESYISYRDTIFTYNDTTYQQRFQYIEADVIKSTWANSDNYIMISKGSEHGIRPDMAVMSPSGVVGVVLTVSRHFSVVMPVLHSNSRNSVKVSSTGIGGSLMWDGKDYRYAQVMDIPNTHRFERGDTIITSGLAGDFPEGIPAGYVESVETLPGSGFYVVNIRLATEFNKLHHVYVINNLFKDEQQKLMKKAKIKK